MMSRINSATLGPRLRTMGLSTYYYQWNNRPRSRAVNIMVLSDPIRSYAKDPSRNIGWLLKQENFQGYKMNGKLYVRTKRPKLTALITFLRKCIELGKHRQVVALKQNEYKGKLIPDPWYLKCDQNSCDLRSTAGEMFSQLGITERTRCGILIEGTDKAAQVCRLAKWNWRRGGQNLYLLCDSVLKVLVCHEGDIHIGSRSSSVLTPYKRLASHIGLFVAPFEIEQCH